ncbi:hypothetical protein AT728_37675 [Streptomyces silvensis]|uniref:Uncharacterized protein n=1 Tax=Streptomyces silvensis TaxID=1765722 RepID=A0A0W7WR41_9ACTN|nr:hypothetical protein AT728_37675 [Streptomyces silvensis]
MHVDVMFDAKACRVSRIDVPLRLAEGCPIVLKAASESHASEVQEAYSNVSFLAGQVVLRVSDGTVHDQETSLNIAKIEIRARTIPRCDSACQRVRLLLCGPPLTSDGQLR